MTRAEDISSLLAHFFPGKQTVRDKAALAVIEHYAAHERLAAQADAPDGWKLVPIHGAEEKVARIKAIGDEVAALQADAPLPIPADKYAVDDPWCRPADLPQSPADVTDAHKHVMQAIKELHEASIPVPMSLHHAAHALHYADTRPDRKSEA
jgi:hypothetical protein